MKSKFNIIYEKIMKSIITEAYDRWDIHDIALATREMTNNFIDEWDDDTYNKIATELKALDHKRGAEHVRANGNAQGHYNADTDRDESEKILNSCLNYWKFRLDHTDANDKYYNSINNSYKIFYLWSITGTNPGGAKTVYTALEIGSVAKAIWKAMNSKVRRTQTNLQKAATMNLENEFNVGQMMQLIFKFESSYFDDNYRAYHLIGKDDRWPDVKLHITAGTELKRQNLEDFAGCPNDRVGAIVDDALPGDVMKITAKVKSIKKENMSIYFNYAKVNSFVEFAKSREEQEKEKKEAAFNKAQANVKNFLQTNYKDLADKLATLGLTDAELTTLFAIKDPTMQTALISYYETIHPGVKALQDEIFECIKKFN